MSERRRVPSLLDAIVAKGWGGPFPRLSGFEVICLLGFLGGLVLFIVIC